MLYLIGVSPNSDKSSEVTESSSKILYKKHLWSSVLEKFTFPACSITTEVKSFGGIFQRVCQDFKTRKQEILNTYFTKRSDLCFTSPVKLLQLSLKCFFFCETAREVMQ